MTNDSNIDLENAKVAIAKAVMSSYNITDPNWINRRFRKNVDARYMIARGLNFIGMDQKRICVEISRDRCALIYGRRIIQHLIETNFYERKRIYDLDLEFAKIRKIYIEHAETSAIITTEKADDQDILIINYLSKDAALKLRDAVENKETSQREVTDFLNSIVEKINSALKKDTATSVNGLPD